VLGKSHLIQREIRRMGILLFVLVVILIATFGFWDTLAAMMGAALLFLLIGVVGVAILGLGGAMLLGKKRKG
jgi:hypothetical protein